MNRNFPLMLVTLLLLVVTSTVVTAQHPSSIAANVPVNEPKVVLSQEVLAALATLPEADTLVFINPRRIINEAIPRMMPEKDLEGLRKAFVDMKQFAGVDPTQLNFIVMAVRFRKPTADLMFAPPEFMAVTSGDFSSEGLVALARAASQGKLRDEKYGEKTLSLMTIDPIVKESEKNPFLKSFSEVGVVPLSANMLAVGTPGYLRAAVDAAAGNGRISVDSLNSLLRDPSVLASVAGSPWDSFAKSLGLLGTEANVRAAKCESNLGDFYVALTMDATNFMLRGAMGADNPDTAKIINNLANGFLRQATSYVPDKTGQNVMSSLKLSATDNEVVLSADVPQQMVLDFMKSQMQPKKQDAAAATKPAAKKPVVRRKRRRPSQ
ncbi:MAG: hypothetical protein ACR2LM_18760 [Pyrinomonadaceae bacterium]